ncbi:MAG: C4-dicarboxylate ABC transporter permease [Burkholderiales bacterium PBB4]|nr:MAG: C4-dicarboxylate ABC transporter permease [Burkholderiales bacterium PBB4]
MGPGTLAMLIFGLMLALMALRAPIAISMALAGAVGYVAQAGAPALLNALNDLAFARFASYDLSVIPLFLLMGHFATQGGLSKALFAFASVAMAPFRGGLAMAAVLASGAFGSICGSSVATAATITSVALPEMRRHGYSGRLATGTLAAGGTLGILIPPSVPLIIYAILAEQNIAKLFAAAVVPGVLAMLGYVAAIAIYVRLYPGHAPAHDGSASRPRMSWPLVRGVLPIAAVFAVVFGGIYGGWCTPTEGAAIGAACTLVAALARRELNRVKLMQCFYATAEGSAMVFLIFIGADLMNSALALTQLPNQLSGMVQSWGLAPIAVVTAMLLFYLVLGAVMDELSMLLLTIPIFFPIVNSLNFGMPQEAVAIWFGILVLMTVGFGMLAPPVGLNVYAVNSLAKDIPIAESYRGILPFLISDTLRMLAVLAFPGIALGLVGWLQSL